MPVDTVDMRCQLKCQTTKVNVQMFECHTTELCVRNVDTSSKVLVFIHSFMKMSRLCAKCHACVIHV